MNGGTVMRFRRYRLSVLVLAGMVNNRATAANGLPPCPPSPPCPPGATAAPPTTSGEAGVSVHLRRLPAGMPRTAIQANNPGATPDLSAIAGEQKEEPSLVSIAGAGLTWPRPEARGRGHRRISDFARSTHRRKCGISAATKSHLFDYASLISSRS